ncbi:MAG: DUF927 domain-containing protein [Gallionellaceae bacterium]
MTIEIASPSRLQSLPYVIPMIANPIEQFRDAMRSAGLEPPDEIIADGNLQRFSSNGKRGDDAGWYVLHDDGIAAGAFGDWRTGFSQTWRADIGRELTHAEKEAHRDKMQAMRRERKAEEVLRKAEAAKKSAAILEASTPAGANHPYLSSKRVSPVATLREIDTSTAATILMYTPKSKGEPLAGRLLVAPVKVGDALSTCELIDEVGRKSAIYGGTKAGGYWAAQPLPEGDGDGLILLIGEGVATVLTAKEASGHPSIAALSAGNLAAVGKVMRVRYPGATVIILADLLKTTGEPDPHAIEAARSIGGLLAIPDFGTTRPDWATDFNDAAVLQGLEAVRAVLIATIESGNAMAPPEPENVTTIHTNAPSVTETPKQDDDDVTQGNDVTAVTAVQANSDGPPGVTAEEMDGVTGVTPEAVIPDESSRPCFKVFDDWTPLTDGGKLKPGVWFFTVKHGKGNAPSVLIQIWICSPLHVQAVTFDGQDNNFGRLLRFKTTVGKWREWSMPMELLRGSGDELRGELLAMGVEIDPEAGRRLLAQYLQAKPPKRRMHCATQVGWCGDSFVLPDTAIGPAASGVIFQSGERGHVEYTRGGTLTGWQSDIAARGLGNPMLTLALSASFAGAMLARCNGESGGIHFVGDSSTGKSTAVEAACSTWGGANYIRSWRSTSNGMEGAASLCNDGLLALDEISECNTAEVGAIIYALGNGRGKQRASRTGNARGVTRWRCFVLSSGERTIATTMAEGNAKAKAGQSVRLLDIPAARRFGTWDNLHGLPSGTAFSDAIKRASVTHYGHAGRAFLERLTRDKRNFCELLDRIKGLPEFSPDRGEGQEKRAAARFALIALAGEMATEYGITGWPEGEAIQAAAEGFKAWCSLRGHGNDERRQILGQVAAFIERHGDSRFSNADDSETSDIMRINRAGWWRDVDGRRIYLFNAEGLREAVKGFDFKRALDTLQEAGSLPVPDASGERATAQRIGGRLVRLYPISADKL